MFYLTLTFRSVQLNENRIWYWTQKTLINNKFTFCMTLFIRSKATVYWYIMFLSIEVHWDSCNVFNTSPKSNPRATSHSTVGGRGLEPQYCTLCWTCTGGWVKQKVDFAHFVHVAREGKRGHNDFSENFVIKNSSTPNLQKHFFIFSVKMFL